MTTRRTRRWFTIVAVIAMATSATATHVGAGAAPPSPAAGDADVIAQGLVDLDDAAQQWTFNARDVDVIGVTVDSATPAFVIAGGDAPVLIEGSDGVRARLAPGEAVFRPAGTSAGERALGTGPATIAEIAIGIAGTTGVGDPFTPGAGPHDLDLVHDRLDPGESVELQSALPALVYVASGAVTDDDSATAIERGGTAVLSASFTLFNGGDIPASVYVAIISPTLDLAVPTSTTAASTTIAPATTVPVVTSPPSPTTPASTNPQPTSPQPTSPPPTSPPTTSPPTTAAATTAPPTNPPTTAPVDTDGDGLTDTQEINMGTNPQNPDSDGDTVGDGAEVSAGTDPTDPNSYP